MVRPPFHVSGCYSANRPLLHQHRPPSLLRKRVTPAVFKLTHHELKQPQYMDS